ncbi:MAG: hypothetical protein WDN01_05995 [Rhizomicrobium sp.]
MAERLTNATGSLADGAERLERLIRGVKDRQFSEALNAPQPKSVSNAYAVSPEEEWSRKFMTAGIGPHDFKPVQMPVISIAAPSAALKPAPKVLEPAIAAVAASPAAPKSVPKAAAPAAAAQSPGSVRPGPIGAAIAKPARKRTWFGRMVRGN